MGFKLSLGTISVAVGADTGDFKKGMKDVDKGLKDTDSTLSNNIKTWAKWAAGFIAVNKAVSVFTDQLKGIRELNVFAQQSNMSVKGFQQMAFASKQFEIQQDKLADILKDVNDRIGDYVTTGAGPMVDFFEQIAPKVGVTADQFRKLSGPDALLLYVQSLQKANLSQQEMTFYMEAMASDSTRLLPLLKNNGEALKTLTKEAEALGIGLDNIDVTKAIQAQRAIDTMTAVLDSETKKVVAELAPFITALSKQFVAVAKNSGGFAQHTINGFEAIGGGASVLFDSIQGIKILFKGLEVAALGFTSLVTLAFQKLSETVVTIGNTILEGWRLIFTEMGKMAGTISDDAKKIFDDIASGINGLKAEVPEFVRDIAQSQIQGLEVAKKELHNMAMEKLPSEKFREFVNEVKEIAAEAAPEIAASLGGSGSGEGDPTGEKSEADRIREENQKILEALLEQSMIREETLLGRLQREKDIIDTALQNERISKAEHERLMTDLEERGNATRLGIVTSTMDAMQQALSVGGKKASKVQRAIAITNAIIKGKQAAVDAWQAGMSVGGPWAPLVAAAYTAASIARTTSMINSIKSGGKSAPAGGGSMPKVGGASMGPSEGGGGGGQSASPGKTLTVKFLGEGLMSTGQVRNLIGQINEQQGDGYTINTAGG